MIIFSDNKIMLFDVYVIVVPSWPFGCIISSSVKIIFQFLFSNFFSVPPSAKHYLLYVPNAILSTYIIYYVYRL